MQRHAQHYPQIEFLSGARRRIRQCLENGEPPSAVRHSFHIRRMRVTTLARELLVAHRMRAEARLGVVMRHQLGLHFHRFGKLCLQLLRNLLAYLLSGASKQGRIGHILDQGVLEDVPGTRWLPLLVEQFRFNELAQFVLEHCLIEL